MTSEYKLPISELFISPQGEGTFAGYLCAFVRTAGCNVGKPYDPLYKKENNLPVYVERCTSWSGESFPCDTNYQLTSRMTIPEILEQVGDIRRIVLTGGEPCNQNLKPFLEACWEANKCVHLETSGTRPLMGIAYGIPKEKLWVCISPKAGYLATNLDLADEIKVLVGEGFDEEKFVVEFGRFFISEKVLISPINGEHELSRSNMDKCLEIQKKHPLVRISIQMHKILGCR